jgi:hypothetical protein
MDKIISKIVKHNKLHVVGVFRHEDAEKYYFLSVKKVNNALNIVAHKTFENIDGLKTVVNKSTPTLLLIDGKGVLSKKTDRKSEVDLAWKKNIDFNAIYHFTYNTPDAEFISFCRKQVLDETVGALSTAGLLIIDFYIGPLAAILLSPALNQGAITSNNSVIELKGTVPQTIYKDQAAQSIYTFNNTQLSQWHLPLYGAAIHYFLKPEGIVKSDGFKAHSDELLYKKAFNFFGIFMLAVFFVSLLSSYIGIQYFLGENVALNQQSIFSAQTYRQMQELEKQKERKMQILAETGQLSSKFLSYYAYRLFASVPEGIKLNGLNVFPVEDEIKNSKQVQVNSKDLLVSGYSNHDAVFDTWLKSLKQMQWIKKFEIITLKKDKHGVQQFEIKIFI